ncbi:MAG: helix-turn-helix transcriptional regulator [Betaproteobacteria bacterium]|nr:MAG: helix-turn-helix transcriptional regulator [Betaproteobacteria bacterium]TMH39903.1 MAG: helix-turn-helix transcriptional regulator [Betaproteobacteria bacterium]
MIQAVKSPAARRLRVAISVQDPALAAELRVLLQQAGHEVVDAAEPADVTMQDASAGFAAASEPDALLTPREMEVLGAIGEGHTNKAIARKLGISLHTVKFHVESLFRKLGARTRTEALAKAAERRVEL